MTPVRWTAGTVVAPHGVAPRLERATEELEDDSCCCCCCSCSVNVHRRVDGCSQPCKLHGLSDAVSMFRWVGWSGWNLSPKHSSSGRWMCSWVSSEWLPLAHEHSSERVVHLWIPGALSCQCREMSWLDAKARPWASRLLGMFQRFRFWVSPSGRMVHCSVPRMSVPSFGDCAGRFGTAFTCLTRCSEGIASSWSRRRRRGLPHRFGVPSPTRTLYRSFPEGTTGDRPQ